MTIFKDNSIFMNARTISSIFLLISLAFCFSACNQNSKKASSVNVANPASVYCVKKGGTIEIVKDESGGEVGMCHLPDGTVIEEWELFRRDNPQK